MEYANAAATALGSLNEVPSGVTCPTDGNGLITTADGIVTTIVTDAGTYTLKSTHAQRPRRLSPILRGCEEGRQLCSIAGSGTDIAYSRRMTSTSLKGIADGPGEDVWGDFETHHGDNWMSAIITDATSSVLLLLHRRRQGRGDREDHHGQHRDAVHHRRSGARHSHRQHQRTLPPRRMPTGTPPRPSTSAPPTLAATPSTLVPTSAVPTTAR